MLDLNGLNGPQRRAVTTIEGPVMVLAGAGTGKTRVITLRMACMVDRGIPPEQILGVTFTNKAAREMGQRVRQSLPAKSSLKRACRELTLSTFHAFGVRVLRRHIGRLGYKGNFVIYSQSEQIGVLKRLLGQIASRGEKAAPEAILAGLSRLKNNGIDPDGSAGDEATAMARRLLDRYQTALRACNAVDFDDLILLCLRLFREHPDILQEYEERYRYVMVDEYQDTNEAQFQLLHLLARGNRNLCVVGDDDQSIYGWRGAQITNLRQLEEKFPEVRTIKLEQNYRSTNTILRAANALIRNNPHRHPKELWSALGPGSKIPYRVYEDDDEEARAVAEGLETARLVRGIPWEEQAVLFRTNQQARPLETALRQAGIRYHLVGGQSFFDRREVKDWVAFMKLLLNPADDNSLLRVANVPARGLSDKTMERLLRRSQERERSVFETMRHSDVQGELPERTGEAIRSFVGLVERYHEPLNQRGPLSLRQWGENFLAEIGYREELRRAEKSAETAEHRVRIIDELTQSLEAPAGGGGSSDGGSRPAERLQAYLEGITLDQDRGKSQGAPQEAVTLITVHSCKGLEFPHVWIVGLEDGIFPHTRSKVENGLDEERRLCYVALTRAQKTLRLSHCRTRRRYGQKLPCQPSPFLQELPEDLLEHGEEADRRPISQQEGKDLFAAMRAAVD